MTVLYKSSRDEQGILQQMRETTGFLDRRKKEYMSKVIDFQQEAMHKMNTALWG